MIYRMHRPGPPLDRFVEWFWFYSDLRADHTMERVLPDGSFELVIDLSDRPRKLFDRHNPGLYRSFRNAWISGARSGYILIDVLQGTSMIGVHFKPGGAAPFLGMPADELTGRVEEADAVWGRGVEGLRDSLLAESSTNARFQLLEKFLWKRLDARLCSERITWAIECFSQDPDLRRTSAIATRLGLSQKHFIFLFRNCTGITPKRFCRLQRFQEVLRQIENRAQVNWAAVATETGYYDQAHFIREFRDFSGLNPSDYLVERGEYLGFVPVASVSD